MAVTGVGGWGGPENRMLQFQWVTTSHVPLTTDEFPDTIHNNFIIYVNVKDATWANTPNISMTIQVKDDNGDFQDYKTLGITNAEVNGEMYKYLWEMNTDGIVLPFRLKLDPASSLASSGSTKIHLSVGVL